MVPFPLSEKFHQTCDISRGQRNGIAPFGRRFLRYPDGIQTTLLLFLLRAHLGLAPRVFVLHILRNFL